MRLEKRTKLPEKPGDVVEFRGREYVLSRIKPQGERTIYLLYSFYRFDYDLRKLDPKKKIHRRFGSSGFNNLTVKRNVLITGYTWKNGD
jgi:hypothetical protein